MDLHTVLEHRAQVEAFQLKHRIGLLTLLFTDIVGSTQLKQQLGDREGVALIQRHHALVREILARFKEAEEISTAGDSFFLVFAKPSEAAKFALLLQTRLGAMTKEIGPPILDRIGIHFGEVVIEDTEGGTKAKDLYGLQVDTCARIMSLAQANQILMTRFVFDNARQVLRGQDVEGVGALSWLNHGPYLLKGVEEPLEICEVGETGKGPLTPPASSEKARRHVSDESEPVLGWRPALEQKIPGTEWVLEKKLGEGGFGEVWLGLHARLKDRRVFKFCFRADRVRSLKREVTLFRVLKERVGHHPNIVGIQEVFFDEPPFYIAMDYAEAKDLRTWSEERGGVGGVPLATRIEIVAQVADALQAAHSAGVIHRDVKPSNILVSQPSTLNSQLSVKLTDFGIGQVVSQEALAGLTRMGFTQTMLSPGSSSQTGTHLYMAPELLAGQPASTRSDIYSLGVVLYQLLIGDFARPLTTDWARRITDPSLREDLEQCFAGDVEERFATGGALANSLRALEQRQAGLREERAAAKTREHATRRRKLVRQTALAFSILAVMAIVLGYIIRQSSRAALPAKAILVLPLKNEISDKANEYLSDSLTGELIARLHKVPGLKVLPTPESMATNSIEDIRMTLASFNVPAIFEGGVQKSGGQLSLMARLVNATDGKPVWTQKYDLDTKGILSLPGEVARAVAMALKIPLSAAERKQISKTPTQNAEAYDAYLRSKSYSRLNSTTEASSDTTIQLLKRAIAGDTNFALAYAELGRVYLDRFLNLTPDEKEWELKAEAQIRRAIFLAPRSAEAHIARGYFLWNPNKRFPHEEAIEEIRKAIALDPQLEGANTDLARIYSHIGLLDEAMQAADRAAGVNPLDPTWHWERGNALLWQCKYKEAMEAWRTLPKDWFVLRWSYTALALVQLGKTNEATAIIDDYLEKHPNDAGVECVFAGIRAVLFAKVGNVKRAEKEIESAIQQKKGFVHFHHTAYDIASAYALMNETNQAITWFKEAVENGLNCYPLFLNDPNLDNLRNDPRFIDLLSKEKRSFDKYKRKFGTESVLPHAK